jgi:hypothetical protein
VETASKHVHGIPDLLSDGRTATLDGVLRALPNEANHFFKGNVAQPQQPANSPAAYSGPNPFREGSPEYSLTKQGEIVRKDRCLAAAMARAAGWDERRVAPLLDERRA